MLDWQTVAGGQLMVSDQTKVIAKLTQMVLRLMKQQQTGRKSFVTKQNTANARLRIFWVSQRFLVTIQSVID